MNWILNWFIFTKLWRLFGWNFEIWAVQRYVHLVDLVKRFPTNIYLQKSASIQPRTSPAKICKKFVKFCKTCKFFCKIFGKLWIFQEFFKKLLPIFSKIRQRDDRCSSSKIFKFTTENFLIFHIFEKKNCWSFSTSNYLLCEAPLCKTIYHGGPKISEAPPGSPDEGGIWCIFANFSEFLEKFLQHFWARSAREDTNSEHLQRATAATGSAVSKKKLTDP